jgi:hypothetical protein
MCCIDELTVGTGWRMLCLGLPACLPPVDLLFEGRHVTVIFTCKAKLWGSSWQSLASQGVGSMAVNHLAKDPESWQGGC